MINDGGQGEFDMDKEIENKIASLSKEKYTALVEAHGWSATFAEGYVHAQMERRMGKPISSYHLVGRDEYALGFRMGYFERINPESAGRGDASVPSGKVSQNDGL